VPIVGQFKVIVYIVLLLQLFVITFCTYALRLRMKTKGKKVSNSSKTKAISVEEISPNEKSEEEISSSNEEVHNKENYEVNGRYPVLINCSSLIPQSVKNGKKDIIPDKSSESEEELDEDSEVLLLSCKLTYKD
jgi:hypothetical protein